MVYQDLKDAPLFRPTFYDHINRGLKGNQEVLVQYFVQLTLDAKCKKSPSSVFKQSFVFFSILKSMTLDFIDIMLRYSVSLTQRFGVCSYFKINTRSELKVQGVQDVKSAFFHFNNICCRPIFLLSKMGSLVPEFKSLWKLWYKS